MQATDLDVELGKQVADEVSGFRGIVTTIAEHLTGCARIGVQPTEAEGPSVRGEEEFFYPSQISKYSQGTFDLPDDPQTEVGIEMGQRVQDDVTGFEGVVSTITYSLFNCPRVAVSPVDVDDVTEQKDRGWFDAPRVSVVGDGISGEYVELTTSTDESATGAPPTDSRTKTDIA